MAHDDGWYWCLEHQAVETREGCRATARLGPYPTAEAAANWRESVEARNEEWDEQDEDWERRRR